MNFDLDVGIFLGFLVLNLAVGLYYGKGVKTIEGYALGGRNFSTGALVATLVATAASGSGFFIALSKTYSDGLWYIIASLGMALSYYLVGVLLVPRMGEFLSKLSVAEAMGSFYGSKIRTITAITGAIGAAGLVAVQFKAFGNVFNYFLGFSQVYSVILAGVVVTMYSAFGGIRSVTFTDVLQFTTFGVAIPTVGLIIWSQLNSSADFSIASVFAHPKFDYSEVLNPNNTGFWGMCTIFFYFIMPGLGPSTMQRILIGKNIAQVRKAFIITSVLFSLVILSIAWIPTLIFSIDPDLEPNQLLSYIVDHYTYTGLKGLVIVSVMALAMSTADSHLNSSSVIFAHDICKPFKIWAGRELLLSRIFSLTLGCIAMTLALMGNDLLQMVLFANSFYMPVVTIPLILTILGFRSSTQSVLIGMAAGFITSMTWKYLEIKEDGIVFAMIVNMLFLMGSHYFLKQPGGWVGIKDTKYLDDLRAEKARSHKKFIKAFQEFSFKKFLEKHSPVSELAYTGFGIYCIIYTFSTMYSTQTELLREHGTVILTIYQIMLVTGVLMALYPIWPARIKNKIVIQSWWNIAIFYMLTLFSVFFLLISQFGSLQLMVFTVNTIIVIILAGWRFGSIMMVIGFYLGLESYKLYSGADIVMNIDHSPAALLLYTFLLLSSVVVIFLKPKQEAQELAWEKVEDLMSRIDDYRDELYKATEVKNEFLRNLQHEARTPITGITSMAQVIDESYDKLPENKKREAIHNIASSAERLISYVDNMIDLSKLSTMKYDLKLEDLNLSELLHEHIEKCKKLYITEKSLKEREFLVNIEKDVIVNCDGYYIGRSIDNIIINAIQYCKSGKIAISLVKHKNAIVLNIKDEGIGIPLDELHNIFGAFTVSAKTRTPAGGRGVGLALVKKVVDLHKGEVWADSDGKSWTMVELALRN